MTTEELDQLVDEIVALHVAFAKLTWSRPRARRPPPWTPEMTRISARLRQLDGQRRVLLAEERDRV